MKKTLQLIMFIGAMLTVTNQTIAQNTVTLVGSATWNGYANVFQANGTDYVFDILYTAAFILLSIEFLLKLWLKTFKIYFSTFYFIHFENHL